MQDKSSYSNPNKPQISEGLQNFINAMVEEIVLKDGNFDERRKKYLRKFSEAEGLYYEELERSFEFFFSCYSDYQLSKSKQTIDQLEQEAIKCFIQANFLKELISKHSQKMQIEEQNTTFEKQTNIIQNKTSAVDKQSLTYEESSNSPKKNNSNSSNNKTIVILFLLVIIGIVIIISISVSTRPSENNNLYNGNLTASDTVEPENTNSYIENNSNKIITDYSNPLYETYENKYREYKIDYPNFLIMGPESGNADGRVFKSADGTIELIVYSSILNQNLDEKIKNDIPSDITPAYKRVFKDSYTISWIENNNIVFEKSYYSKKADECRTFKLIYPKDLKDSFNSIINRITKSFQDI